MRFAFLVGAVLVLATACGQPAPGRTTTPTTGTVATQAPGTAAPPASEAPATQAPAAIACEGSGGTQVDIADFSYIPAQSTTTVGSTITWTNRDSVPHTVSFDDGPECDPERLNNGDTQSMTFSAPGTFAYHCEIHSQMRGSVTVQ